MNDEHSISQEEFLADDLANGWLSTLESEREWQINELKKIFGHFPKASPLHQYMNGLIDLANKATEKGLEWISVEDRLPTHNDLLPSNGDPRYKEPLILVWDFEANLPRIIHYVTFEKEYYSHWKIINLAPPNK